MFTRFVLSLLCLLLCVVLQAQPSGYTMTSKLSKEQEKSFLKNYNAMPDTLPDMEQYDTVIEQILLAEASSRTEVLLAIFKEVVEQVLVKEAYNGYREPVYKSVEEKILIQDAYKIPRVIPAVYDTLEENILVNSPKWVWIKNKRFKGKIVTNCYDSSKGMDTCLWQLTSTPAQYMKCSKKSLKTPESVETEQVDAQFITINKMVIDPAATAQKPLQKTPIVVAAEYRSVEKKILVTDATTRKIEIPAEYGSFTSKKLLKSGVHIDYSTLSPFFVAIKENSSQLEAYPPASKIPPPPPPMPPRMAAKPQSPNMYSHDMHGDMPRNFKAPRDTQNNLNQPNDRRSNMGEAKVSSSKIQQIQEALIENGYDPGPINNVLGPQTRQALIQFQKDLNLPVGNLNIETMRALLGEEEYGTTKPAEPTEIPDYFSQVNTYNDLENARKHMEEQLQSKAITQAQFNGAQQRYLAKRDLLAMQFDKPALFANGNESISNFVKNNLQYPQDARQYGIEGTVVVNFTVDSTGKVVNPGIEKGISWDLNESALKLIEQMPLWKPQTQFGKNIASEQQLALQFKLDDKGKKTSVGLASSFKPIIENEFLATSQNPLSTFSIDVDNAAYSIARTYVEGGQLPPPDAVRTEEFINYFKYDYPQPTDKHPFSISTEMQRCPWNDKHYLLLIGLQGKEIEIKNTPPSNLVFLIDVSGSMSEELPLVVQSLSLLVEKMRPQDHISIVVYAGASGLVLPSTSGKDKEKILATLPSLGSGGSTAGGAGIQLAYKTARENFLPKGNNRIILITDGDFNVGVTSEADLTALIEKERESGVFLTCLGIGQGNYQDSRMEMLADKGNGNYAYIDNLKEAKKILVEQMSGTLLTIAKDVKLQIDFNPANIKGYRLVGYENRVMEAQDFDNDRKDAGELGAGHSVTALYEIILHSNTSTNLKAADSLKNKPTKGRYTQPSGDLLTVKLRYKLPTDSTSLLIEKPLGRVGLLKEMSNNFKWASGVAAYALCLRNSQFKGTATFEGILKNAQNALTFDPNGYRKDFIELVRQTMAIPKP